MNRWEWCYLSLLSTAMFLALLVSGCTTTEIIDAIQGLTNAPPAVVTNLPPIVTPDKPVATSEIQPIAADSYSYGTPSDGGHQYEVWQHNWHRMNIRVHCNPGELRKDHGIPAGGKWYPLDMSRMPSGIVTMTKTATGATFTAKDFMAASGQRYRFEGFRADRLGTLSKVYTLTLTDSQMGGALMVWYASVK